MLTTTKLWHRGQTVKLMDRQGARLTFVEVKVKQKTVIPSHQESYRKFENGTLFQTQVSSIDVRGKVTGE